MINQTSGAIQRALHTKLTRDHVAEFEFDGPKRRDGLTKLAAVGRVAHRFTNRHPGAAAAHAGELEPAVVEHVERDLVALAHLTEQVLCRHTCVLQNHGCRGRPVQSHLVFFLAVRHTGEVLLHDKCREVFAVNLGKHDVDVGETTVGDPHLFAVEHPRAVGLFCGPRTSTERIRPGAGLAQAVGADQITRHDARQVLLLLRLGAKTQDRNNRETCLRAKRGGKRRTAPHDLADDDRGRLVEVDAAKLLGHVSAEQPQIAAAFHHRPRKRPVLGLHLRQRRQHLLLQELGRRLGDQAVVVAEPLGRQHRVVCGGLKQPGGAFGR